MGDSVALQTLVIDSREVKDGDLFAALSGQRVDGHDFAPQALAAGASALLTERVLEGLSPQLVVADVLEASGRFGALKRQAFEGDVIAITGARVKPRRKIWWRQRWQQPVRYTRPVAIRIMSWVFRSRSLD